MSIANLTFNLITMPERKRKAEMRLSIDKEGVHLYLAEREIWIEVNDEGNLVAHAYRNQKVDDLVTVVITREKIFVE